MLRDGYFWTNLNASVDPVGKGRIVSVKKLVDRGLTCTSRWLGRGVLRCLPDQHALLTFLFHSLFENAREIEQNLVDPQQGVTLQHFRQFLEHFLGHGYQFVNPEQVLRGLPPRGRYLMITFDDGYFNNVRALPILREYQVPAVFFITAGHVAENRSFWWDVLYRKRTKAGVAPDRITEETERLKTCRHDEIERHQTEQWGTSALRPVGDLDRPMTPGELRDFAQQPFVSIGNHTRDHAMLTNYPSDSAHEQIVGAQTLLREMTGITPVSICYPYGSYSTEVVNLARSAGLQLGITCDPRKNRLPLDGPGDDGMRLGRFLLEGNDRVNQQCEISRADFDFYPKLKRWVRS